MRPRRSARRPMVEGAWGKTVAGGKEEGQLVLYGSRDFDLCEN